MFSEFDYKIPTVFSPSLSLLSSEMELQRSFLGLLLGFLVLSLTPLSSARFVVEKNSLRVTSPDKIKGTYDSAIGNFGIPQYGGSMAGAVLYPKENQKGCKEFSEFGISFKSTPGALPTFVLVDRGGTHSFLSSSLIIVMSFEVQFDCFVNLEGTLFVVLNNLMSTMSLEVQFVCFVNLGVTLFAE